MILLKLCILWKKEIDTVSLKSLFSAKDMTQGSPAKRIMEFAIPMLLGNFAQQLYNTADSIIVGKFEIGRAHV